MPEKGKAAVGSVVWRDLTVEKADEIQKFYCDVVGWRSRPHAMGNYHDFDILATGGETVAGICHARGENASLPPQWLIYIKVEDVDESAKRCVAQGGRIIDGPRAMGDARFCVIQDPAGAFAALISD